MRRKLAAGNWKMNGTSAALEELATLAQAHPAPGCDILICPPATLLHRAADTVAASAVAVGGQDCHANTSGAHTGDISADMLRDAGATSVIVGHSERRTDHGESDAQVQAKAEAAIAAGLIAIVCVGESLEQREAGETLDLIRAQLAGSVPQSSKAEALVVAYEPVWAIGTGETATPEAAQAMHAVIRARLAEQELDALPVLYGGSVKADNAAELFAQPDIDGGLVGGASLDADGFGAIVDAARVDS